MISLALWRNFVTEISFSKNFETVVSRYLLAAAARKSGVPFKSSNSISSLSVKRS